MSDKSKCSCGKGYASKVDGMCKFCREKTFRRAEAKKIGVSHRGDGLTLEDLDKYRLREFSKFN